VNAGFSWLNEREKLCVMKKILVWAALLLAAPLVHCEPLRVAQVPLRADALARFAPRGWRIEKRIDGDLDGKGRAGAALILVEYESSEYKEIHCIPRNRALVVVLREKNGWRRVGVSDSLLLDTNHGAFYAASITSEDRPIGRGVSIVELAKNSKGNDVAKTYRLRFDPKQNAVFLVGFGSSVQNKWNGTGSQMSVDFLTGVRKVSVYHDRQNHADMRVTRVSRQLRRLEDLSEDDRYDQ